VRGRQQWFTYTTLANTCRQNIEITQILALAGKQTFMEIELAPAFQFQSSAQENWTWVGGLSYSLCYLITAQQLHMCHLCHGMPDAFCANSQCIAHPHALPLTQCLKSIIYCATRLPLAFFFGVSAMVRSMDQRCQQASRIL
jgi:hypothetical protein